MKISRILSTIGAMVLFCFGTTSVYAHTIGVGTVNAGAPGSVTIWLGSYHNPTEGGPNEGSMQLTQLNGSPIVSPVTAFSLASNTMPTGLVAGSNFFYAQASPGSGTAGQFDQTTNNTGQTIIRWQGVTFTGLSAGTYDYQISGMNTAVWADWNSLSSNWLGQLTISGDVIIGDPVPEPGSLALIALGLAGVAAARRKKAAA